MTTPARTDLYSVPLRGLARAVVDYGMGAVLCIYVAAHFYSLLFGIGAFSTGDVIRIGLVALFVELLFIDTKHGLAYVIVLVVLAGYLASALFYSKARVGDAAMILANGGILLVLLRRRIFVPIVYAMFLAVAGFFVTTAASGGTSTDALAGPNGVSWLMIQAVVFLYVVLDKEEWKISLLPALITLPLCIWAWGRSGIVSSALLLLGIALLYFRQNRRNLALLGLALVGLLATGILGGLLDLANSYLWYFNALGFDPRDRDVLISHYWRELDATSLLMGEDLSRDSFWQLWGFNPHNSYLLMHSWIGLAAFVLIGLMLGAVVRSFFCAKKLYGLLLVVVMLRAATDPLFFLGTFDFLVFYLVVRVYGEPAPALTRMWSAVAHRNPKAQ